MKPETKKQKMQLTLSEEEYGHLFPLVVDTPAECYSDYYFETEGLEFIRGKGSMSIRDYSGNYILTLTAAKNDGSIRNYEKAITVNDFIHTLKRGIPRDLIEDFPLKWKNNPLEHREIINLSHTDTEAWGIAVPGGVTIFLKEIDCVRTTRYEIEFEYADENEKAAVKRFLQNKGIKWIPVKKSGYELLFAAWKSALIGEDAELGDGLQITFKSKLIPGFTHEQRFKISLKSEDGLICPHSLVQQ